jgi:hypothetical protein
MILTFKIVPSDPHFSTYQLGEKVTVYVKDPETVTTDPGEGRALLGLIFRDHRPESDTVDVYVLRKAQTIV